MPIVSRVGTGINKYIVAGTVTFSSTLKGASLSLSNGDLTVTQTVGAEYDTVLTSIGHSTGKFYCELVANSMAGVRELFRMGVGQPSILLAGTNAVLGFEANSWGWDLGTQAPDSGPRYNNNVQTLGYTHWATGDTVGIAIDMTLSPNGRLWFARNGTWQGGGDPAAGTSPAYSNLSGTIHAGLSMGRLNAIASGRFTASSFVQTMPAGFRAWDGTSG